MKKLIYNLLILWLTTCTISAKEESFFFQFNNEDLVDIVNQLAARKEVNIVFPVKNPIASRVTMFIEEPFTIDEAWTKLYTILDLAGYSLIKKDSKYTIVKTEKDITKEALPLFIGIPPQQIPDSDERIRYIYFLSNLKVTELDKSDLGAILKELLPETAAYQSDSITNSLILIDKANNIKSTMEVITKLDSATYQESFDVIKLYNTDPTIVAKLFEDILKINDASRYRFETKKQLSEASYFPKNIRIVPLPRTNSILVLGTQVAIDRIRDFLTKYIDVELESGKSILHIFKLQYMDADKVADVLRKVLESSQKSSSDQAKTEKGEVPINPKTLERFFDEVIIQTDKPSKGGDEAKYFGNNNIIVAARNDDWLRIKTLIETLDKPNPQVIIEVLVANLTLQDTRALGGITRNPRELGFPAGVNIQTAQIGNGIVVAPVLNDARSPVNITSTIAPDLMTDRLVFDASGNQINQGAVAGQLQAGSTAIAFDDRNNGTWGVMQLLSLFSYTKVISHPHLIATNNTNATVKIGQSRLLADQTAGSGGGTAVVKNKDIFAELVVDIKPRIFTSAIPGQDSVSLQVTVNITDFLPGSASVTNNARITRLVETNAMLKNGQILALGGLISNDATDGVSGTPILEKIPLLGWLAKKRSTLQNSANITIFIAPTIIEPRLSRGTGKYTEDYVAIAKKYAKEGELFDSLQDPITRWFFKNDYGQQNSVKDFMDQDETKRKPEEAEYKRFVDAEQAASIEETAVPEKKKKKSKTVVLTNVDQKNVGQSSEAPRDNSAPNEKIAACADIAQPKKEDPLLALLKQEPEEMVLAQENSHKMPMSELKSRLEKLLASEENPLL